MWLLRQTKCWSNLSLSLPLSLSSSLSSSSSSPSYHHHHHHRHHHQHHHHHHHCNHPFLLSLSMITVPTLSLLHHWHDFIHIAQLLIHLITILFMCIDLLWSAFYLFQYSPEASAECLSCPAGKICSDPTLSPVTCAVSMVIVAVDMVLRGFCVYFEKRHLCLNIFVQDWNIGSIFVLSMIFLLHG